MSETNLLDLLDLTAAEIIAAVKGANYTNDQLAALRDAEASGKTRKTVVEAIDAELAEREPAAEPDAVAPEEQAIAAPPAELVPVTLAEAELRIGRAEYTGERCEILVSTDQGWQSFEGTGEDRQAAYRSAVGAWLASEGKALA